MAFTTTKKAGPQKTSAAKPTGALGGIKINKAAFAKGNEAYKNNAGGGDYPDSVDLEKGVYSCILIGGKGQEVNGEPKVVFEFLVGDNEITEDSAGKQVAMWFSLNADEVEGKSPLITWLYRFLSNFDYDVTELSTEKLEEILEDIKANPKGVQLQAKEKDGYVNLRLKKVLEGVELTDILSTYGGAEATGEEEGIDLDELSREELKKFITENKLKILVHKGLTDEMIRKKIKEATK